MELTQEQTDILSSLRDFNQVKIFAFAGTGKTTTLKAVANAYPQARILYLAFNKAIEQEAKNKFPRNVEVRTIHSLAYKYIGRNYRIQNLNTTIISELFSVDYVTAYEIINEFEDFCNSAFLTIEELLSPHQSYIKLLYQKMKEKRIAANHSFYLKEFQLNLANGNIRLNYDIVLLDEAQDTNPVTFSIFNLINAKKKIAVGDRHQQIYAFRGAVNALEYFEGGDYYLTNSFRFNEKIAKAATLFLKVWKGEQNEIKGLETKKEIKTKAILSRTNAYLIEKTAFFIKNNVEFKFVREPYSVFGLSLNLLRLKNNDDLDKQFNYLSKFTYKELLEMTNKEDFNDIELKSAVNIVEKYQKNLISYYMKAKDYFYDNNLKPKYYLSTAHTAKGLEWDEVTLMEDFNSLYKKVANLIKERNMKNVNPYRLIKALAADNYKGLTDLENEINLFYVAYTRAKVKVINFSDVSFKKDKINQEIENLLKG